MSSWICNHINSFLKLFPKKQFSFPNDLTFFRRLFVIGAGLILLTDVCGSNSKRTVDDEGNIRSCRNVSRSVCTCMDIGTVDPRPVSLFLSDSCDGRAPLSKPRSITVADSPLLTMMVHSTMLTRARLLPNDPFASRKRLLLKPDGPRLYTKEMMLRIIV